MSFINFIIAVVALVVAILAYKKAGGDTEGLKEQLTVLRGKTAEALEKAEKAIRPDAEKKPGAGTKPKQEPKK